MLHIVTILLRLKIVICNNSVAVQNLHTIKKKCQIHSALIWQTHLFEEKCI